jgi:hypothetical protein
MIKKYRPVVSCLKIVSLGSNWYSFIARIIFSRFSLGRFVNIKCWDRDFVINYMSSSVFIRSLQLPKSHSSSYSDGLIAVTAIGGFFLEAFLFQRMLKLILRSSFIY